MRYIVKVILQFLPLLKRCPGSLLLFSIGNSNSNASYHVTALYSVAEHLHMHFSLNPRLLWPHEEGSGENFAQKCLAGMSRFLNSFQIFNTIGQVIDL